MLSDGTTVVSAMLGASGIHVLGELPAGTEIPMLGMPNGKVAPNFAALAGSAIFPGAAPGMYPEPSSGAYGGIAGMYNNGQPVAGFQQTGGNEFASQQTTGGLPKAFPQRASDEEERLRQQLAIYDRLIDDWIQFTEEKWRTVSDSQLGWKPLRGMWSGWEDFFLAGYPAQKSYQTYQHAPDVHLAPVRRF